TLDQQRLTFLEPKRQRDSPRLAPVADDGRIDESVCAHLAWRRHRSWRRDKADQIGQAARWTCQLVEQRSLLLENLATRTGADKPASGRDGGRSYADKQRTRTRVGIDDARARTRAALLVEHFEPLTVVQRS